MDTSQYSVGTQSKSVYIQGLGIRGLPKSESTPHLEYTEEKTPMIELYAERWEQGLDIWTGEPLQGAGLTDWENQRKRGKRLK